jgi:predicted porin
LVFTLLFRWKNFKYKNLEIKLKLNKRDLLFFLSMLAIGAHAQSSVTLYGVVDDGLTYVSNVQKKSGSGRSGGSQFAMTDDDQYTDRWGLKGAEDLGGGYQAIFTLESGYNVNSGQLEQGGTFFGRQAYMGIASPYGTVTLGRQYDPIVDYIQPFIGSLEGGEYAIEGNDLNNFGDSFRVNNAIKFSSISYDGLKFGGLYGFGGVPGSFSRNSVFSVGGIYKNGPLGISAAYLKAYNPNLSYWGDNQSSSGTGNNVGSVTGVQSNPVYSGFASASRLQIAAAAAQYSFTTLSVGVNYSNVSFQGLNDPASGSLPLTNPLGYTGTATFNSYSVYGRYHMTPFTQFDWTYLYLVGGGVNDKEKAKYNQLSLAIARHLSKRTDIYATAQYQIASGTDSTGQRAVASFQATTASNSSHQLLIHVGIRHIF